MNWKEKTQNTNWINKIRLLLFSQLVVRRIYKFLSYFLFPTIFLGIIYWKKWIDYRIIETYKTECLMTIAFFLIWFMLVSFIYRKLTCIAIGWEKLSLVLTERIFSVEIEKNSAQKTYSVVDLKNLKFYLHKHNHLVEVEGELWTEKGYLIHFFSAFPSSSLMWNIWQQQIESQKLPLANTLFRSTKIKILIPALSLIVFLTLVGAFSIWVYEVKILGKNPEQIRRNEIRIREEKLEQKRIEEEKRRNYMKPLLPEQIKWTFDDVGGYKEAKEKLKNIASIIKEKESKKHVERGIVLYGPPGTGKTILAQAFAKEAGLSFYFASGDDLKTNQLGIELGANHDKLFSLFDEVNDYRKRSGLGRIILFIDEFDNMGGAISDSFGGIKEGLMNDNRFGNFGSGGTELKSLMGGGKYSKRFENIVVIVTTNNIGWFDEGVLRPQRLGKLFEIGFPKKDDLKEVISIHLKNFQRNNPEEKFDSSFVLGNYAELLAEILIQKPFHFTGADVEEIIKLLPNFKESEEELINKTTIEKCIDDFCREKITNKKRPTRLSFSSNSYYGY